MTFAEVRKCGARKEKTCEPRLATQDRKTMFSRTMSVGLMVRKRQQSNQGVIEYQYQPVEARAKTHKPAEQQPRDPNADASKADQRRGTAKGRWW